MASGKCSSPSPVTSLLDMLDAMLGSSLTCLELQKGSFVSSELSMVAELVLQQH